MAFSPGRGSAAVQRGLTGSASNSSRPGLQLRDEASLNILIPMGGGGEAFREAGYAFPKPLIKIVGRPMLLHLLDNLQTRLGDVVWLVVPEALYAQYEATLCLSQEYPEVDIRVVTFNMKTRGAVETLFIGLRHMSEAELNRRVVCLDCDTLYFSDVLGQFRGLPKENGACFYFVDQGSRAMYSYLRVGADDLVKEVREKNAISRMANVGAYGFPTAPKAWCPAGPSAPSTRNTRESGPRRWKRPPRRTPRPSPKKENGRRSNAPRATRRRRCASAPRRAPTCGGS